ncbi:MAG: hypothetical protein ABIU05_25310, partial [Nitrospirales bacterium]
KAMTIITVTAIRELQNGQSIIVDMGDVFLSKAAPNRHSSTTQNAQNDIPARPQGVRRPERTLGVRCRETSD